MNRNVVEISLLKDHPQFVSALEHVAGWCGGSHIVVYGGVELYRTRIESAVRYKLQKSLWSGEGGKEACSGLAPCICSRALRGLSIPIHCVTAGHHK